MYSPVNVTKEILLFIALFFAISLALFWGVNGGAYFNEIRFVFSSSLTRDDPAPNEGSIATVRQVKSSGTSILVQGKTPIPAAVTTAGMMLSIPKIQVSAPVISAQRDSMQEILSTLEKGVGLYPGSNLPGQGGRGVLLGHSSRASWYRGNYAYIFSLLPKLEVGDEFTITQNSTKYIYRVFAKSYLPPAEANKILGGPARGSELDLMTCYPIGSASKRTLIQAELIRADSV